MSIVSEYKKALFNTTDVLISRSNKNGIFPYKISSHIPFNKEKHWVIYDFKNEKVMRRTIDKLSVMEDFQENTYKNENNEEITFDIPSYIAKNSSSVMIECNLPEGRGLLAIFDDTRYTLEDYDYIWYNLFHTYIQGKIYEKSKEYINSITYKLIPKMHWVWFRKPGAYITERIIRRSKSWLELNPEIQFHLWTNMKNEDEIMDFLTGNITDLEIKEERKEYRKRINIHCIEDTYKISKEFCDENSSILKNDNLCELFREILDDTTYSSSMIFKTDILRCMILHQLGGWYTDFNDTYCFVPLKYIVNQDRRNLIYNGCDMYTKQNNYIMYSSDYNTTWLEITTQIIQRGTDTYKLLKISDEDFLNSIKIIVSSFCSSCLENQSNQSFLESVTSKIAVWLNIYDKKIDELIAKYNLNIPHSFHFIPNELLLLIRYLFSNHNSTSSVADRISYELSYAQSLNKNRMRKYVLRWKNNTWDKTYKWDECIKELNELKDAPFSDKLIMNTTIFTNIQKLLYITNMGAYFQDRKDLSKQLYNIPHCLIMESFSFMTALGHIGDGTSVGGDIYTYSSDSI
jgi:hypothetical protein